MPILTLLFDKKKHIIKKVQNGRWQLRLAPRMEIPLTLDDLITPGKIGFEALHEKLEILAAMHKFNIKPVLTVIATSSILRRVYLVRDCNIPPYVVLDIFKLLQEAGACNGGSGILRKTSSYVEFLRNVVTVEKTIPSVTSQSTKQRYTLPDGVDDYTAIMLQEELRMIEDDGINIAATTLAKLRKMFHAKQREERETIPTKKGKRRSEMDQVSEAIAEEEVEYSDVPKKKRKK